MQSKTGCGTKVIVVVFLLFYTSHTSNVQNLVSTGLWNEYKGKYNLKFSPSEEAERRDLFLDNLRFIEEVNARNEGFTLAMNEYGHMSPSELTMRTLMRRSGELRLDDAPATDSPVRKSIDWRTHNVVSRVKNQGICGSCYAFSGVHVDFT
ncbi:Digestive cysteine proteinase 2 [Thelohanellus kitauei]|uniref:Digestive cysteine proteinase 2 n=1 Tax=Thelohanellus kitauei TaxID=669202 RepID=A0A0C2IHS9_THEKT|nr:Digestive cysteine proteinase 2 [Thelohanellus kitauei]